MVATRKGNKIVENNSTFSTNTHAGFRNVFTPATDLAKQFDGYKYGIAPLKKITEPLLVFRKAPKNKSVLADLLAFENDNEISPAVMDIENNRVQLTETDKEYTVARAGYKDGVNHIMKANADISFNVPIAKNIDHNSLTHVNSGRFPCTLFLTPQSAELLDSQLDLINFELNGKLYQSIKRKEYERIITAAVLNNELKSYKELHVKRETMQIAGNKHSEKQGNGSYFGGGKISGEMVYNDSGYLSRVMHHADFTQDDYDSLLNSQCSYQLGVNEDTVYEPTVSPKERNLGCEGFEKKQGGIRNSSGRVISGSKSTNGDAYNEILQTNNHPTLKPVELIQKMSALFKLPKGIKQMVYVPFSGAGSEIIGLMLAGYDLENIIACEINTDYVEIAKARIAHYKGLQPKTEITKEVTKEIINTQNTLF